MPERVDRNDNEGSLLDQLQKKALCRRSLGVGINLGLNVFGTPFPGLEVFAGETVATDRHMIDLHPFADLDLFIVLVGPGLGVGFFEVAFSPGSRRRKGYLDQTLGKELFENATDRAVADLEVMIASDDDVDLLFAICRVGAADAEHKLLLFLTPLRLVYPVRALRRRRDALLKGRQNPQIAIKSRP